jgi:NAD(P)-dependent dehydrogenase (short-subunit alcohol dehydrogenase family)
MCARNSDAIHAAAGELEREGHRADAVVADVARLEDIERVALHALRRFGRIESYLQSRPQNPPPYYTPRVVARAILHCAEHPTRELGARNPERRSLDERIGPGTSPTLIRP